MKHGEMKNINCIYDFFVVVVVVAAAKIIKFLVYIGDLKRNIKISKVFAL